MASRAVLVTGGSRGIGAAVARAFAERGDRVAVHYASRRSSAEEVADLRGARSSRWATRSGRRRGGERPGS